MSAPNVCEHGSLARQCVHCELARAAAEIDRLRAALRFYADPASVYPGAEWPHGYPGGIVYRVGRDAIRDSGQIAIAALAP